MAKNGGQPKSGLSSSMGGGGRPPKKGKADEFLRPILRHLLTLLILLPSICCILYASGGFDIKIDAGQLDRDTVDDIVLAICAMSVMVGVLFLQVILSEDN